MAEDNTGGLRNGLLNSSLPNTRTLADLLLTRPEVRGLYYNGKNIKLDGYIWIGCRFDNCKLEVSSTNFEIKDCIIDSTNQVVYGNAVIKIIKLFTSRYDWAYEHFPHWFVPLRTPISGAITIQDNA